MINNTEIDVEGVYKAVTSLATAPLFSSSTVTLMWGMALVIIVLNLSFLFLFLKTKAARDDHDDDHLIIFLSLKELAAIMNFCVYLFVANQWSFHLAYSQ
jgi:hypothetical protein